MHLAHGKCSIEWKNLVLATAGCLHQEHSKSFAVECHLLNAAWFLLSLPPQLSWLLGGGIPSALFSAFLAVVPPVLPEDEAILQSQRAYDGLLSRPLPLSGIPIQGKKDYKQAICFFLNAFHVFQVL